MKIIVCGAGQVGYNIAHHLALEAHDVTVVDMSEELIQRISNSIDVHGIVGLASHPDVLEKAGINDTDLIIAVTQSDEVNMVACQVAHSLFDVPKKIARIRQQSYLDPVWANLFSADHMPIDVIISPEIEVARSVTRRLEVPGAFEMIPLVDNRIKLLGVRCSQKCPLVNTALRQLTQLFPDLNIVIIGIIRNNVSIIPDGNDQMLHGDEVYFVVDSNQIERAMAAFGYEEQEARKLVIFGGGNIGLFLAKELEENYHWVQTKIIESNPERAKHLTGILEHTLVLQGNVLEQEILDEANISSTQTAVAVTNDDETNILASLLSKRFGCHRTIALINKTAYEPLKNSLNIDVVVSPKNITASKILQHVRRGRIHSVHTLHADFGELIEAEALDTSSLVGTSLRESNLPEGVLIGAIVRDNKMICPNGDTVIEADDRVVLFAAAKAIKKVESLFSVQLEYF